MSTEPVPVAAEEAKSVKSKFDGVKATLYLSHAEHELLRKLSYERHRKQHDLMKEALHQWFERETGKTARELAATDHAGY
jgi:hypothetical protein